MRPDVAACVIVGTAAVGRSLVDAFAARRIEGVVHVVVLDEADAATALRSRLRARVVVVDVGAGQLGDAVTADLRRLGPIHDLRRTGSDPVLRLSDAERAILLRIVEGATVAEAAKSSHVSLRTGHRRVASAVAALGASSVVDAAVVIRRWVDALVAAPVHEAPPLVGRAAPLEALVRAAAGPGFTVVAGPSGSGVSAMLDALHPLVGARTPIGSGLAMLGAGETALQQIVARPADALAGLEDGLLGGVLVSAAAGGPVLVDDAQLLDERSRGALRVAAQTVPVVVGLVVDGAVAGALLPEDTTIVRLGPLDLDAAGEVVRHVAPALCPADRHDVVRLGEGHAGDLVAMSCSDGALDRAVHGRVEQVLLAEPEHSPTSLACIGLARGPIPAHLLHEPTAARLVAMGLVDRAGDLLVPPGPRVRRAIEELLPPGSLVEANRALASAQPDPLIAAEHLLAAGQREAAAVLASRVADDPTDPGRFARALAVVARSTDPIADLMPLDRAVRSLVAVGAHIDALDLVQTVGDEHPAVRGATGFISLLSGSMAQNGDAAGAVELLTRAIEDEDRSVADLVRLRTVRAGMRLAAADDVSTLLDEVAALADENPEPVDTAGRMMRGVALALAGDDTWIPLLLPAFEDALASTTDAAAPEALVLMYASEITAFFLVSYGEPDAAVHLLDRAIEHLVELGAPEGTDLLVVTRVIARIGSVGPRADLVDELRVVLAGAPVHRLTAVAAAVLAVAEADRGRFGPAEAALELARSAPPDPMGEQSIAWAEAELALLAGEADRAVERALVAAGHAASFLPVPTQAVGLVRLLALGSPSMAVPSDSPSPYPSVAWVGDVGRALEAVRAGAGEDAIAHVRTALGRSASGRRDQLRIQRSLGDLLVAEGQADEGEALLVDLLGRASVLGFEPLAAQVRRSLRSLGRRTSPSAAVAILGLTERETTVLGLVADGLTSPQIAARLQVSRSTVETVVRHAIAKLGARSRREAAAQVRAALDEHVGH